MKEGVVLTCSLDREVLSGANSSAIFGASRLQRASCRRPVQPLIFGLGSAFHTQTQCNENGWNSATSNAPPDAGITASGMVTPIINYSVTPDFFARRGCKGEVWTTAHSIQVIENERRVGMWVEKVYRAKPPGE
jgi:hypothetical protein